MSPRDSRSVFETGRGRLCPKCGWPENDCRCSSGGDEPVPAKITCVLRLEKKAAAVKSVTVVANLPRNAAFLSALAAELKKACGTGGAARPRRPSRSRATSASGCARCSRQGATRLGWSRLEPERMPQQIQDGRAFRREP